MIARRQIPSVISAVMKAHRARKMTSCAAIPNNMQRAAALIVTMETMEKYLTVYASFMSAMCV